MRDFVAVGTPKGAYFAGDTITGASVANGGTASVNGWTIDTGDYTDLRAMIGASAIAGSGVVVQAQESIDGVNWVNLGAAVAVGAVGLTANEPAEFSRFVRYVVAEAGAAGDSGTVTIMIQLKGE